ncbi:nuclear GTPase SLIP-GC 3 [Podospora australis]|uniref:Nuclear GTPase SLIP-GC 3 n=1 Tax=Podospora australis TaxID=1536484 RepID=A0AAN7AE59_9PEZI|nr:nuclear GTPase SLIP-GC 3 [Podospora australis]
MEALAMELPRASSPSCAGRDLSLHSRASIVQSVSSRPSTARNRRSSSRVAQQSRHNVRDEEPPQDRFHEPAFQHAFRNAKSLMANPADVLESSAPNFEADSVIQTLRREADTLANFQCRSARVVGLVGETGAGKSSLLNSLLDVKGLSRTSNSGAACTCVATEYRYHEDDRFMIKVEEFSTVELREQFTEMVQNYRHSGHTDSAVLERDENTRDGARPAQLASDTLGAMFRGRLNHELLMSGPEDQVVETLPGWTRERDSAAGERIAATHDECSEELMWLPSEEVSPRGPALWPYIKKISVYLNAHILSNGLVLVDLPGLRDLNSARRLITERYLRTCDEIFAVCRIGRATDDAGVLSVFRLAKEARLSNVGIICTRSDDISAEEAKRIKELERALSMAKRNLKSMQARLDELEDEDDDLEDEEQAEKTELVRNIERQRAAKKDHKLALQEYLVTTRNAFVTAELTKKYKSLIPAGNELAVYCASNDIYWKYRDETSSKSALPFLRLSGIIGLRQHCIALVSEGQLRMALRFMKDEIPNLISKFELWVQSGAGSADVERKRVVREALDLLEAHIRQKFRGRTSPFQMLSRSLLSGFNATIYQRRNINRWTRGAMNAGFDWCQMHPASYAAFSRHYGIHSTGAVRYRNWNEEAIQAMAQDLSDPWSPFQQELQQRIGSLVGFIDDIFDSAVEHLPDFPDDQYYNDTVSTLQDALESSPGMLGEDAGILCDEFEAKVSELRTSALSGLETAFFCQGMRQTYIRAANCESDPGSFQRKEDIINSRQPQEDLVVALQERIKEEVRDILNDAVEILDIMRSENAVGEDSEEDREFRARAMEEVQHVKATMGDIQLVIGNGSL